MTDKLTDPRYKPRIRFVDEQGYTKTETDLLASAIVLEQELDELRAEVAALKKSIVRLDKTYRLYNHEPCPVCGGLSHQMGGIEIDDEAED
jgi:DNA repair exonuclease SbcCD ATPase subunit